MKICRVIGPVVSTVKHPTYHGTKLLAVQPLDENGEDVGNSYLAVDRVQAGEGDKVLIMSEGNGVRQLFKMELLPIRSVIVAIIDEIDLPDPVEAGL